jgi:hypothetical protein
MKKEYNMKLDFHGLKELQNSEYHYLIDTLEYELHSEKSKDSLIVYEYTSNILEISKELILNNIEFSHHISKDVELSYLIIKI